MPQSCDKLIRCPLCLEELYYLECPKALPCSHVHCLSCLENNTQQSTAGLEMVCGTCSKVHILPNLDQLPGPSHDSSEAEADDQSVVSDDDGDTTEVTRIECDRCNDLEKLDAVCFCVDCNKRLCKDHESAHHDYFSEGEHKIISIQVYRANETSYMKPKCEQHGYDIGMCCSGCWHLLCPLCKIDGNCKDRTSHSLHSLADMEDLVKSDFAKLQKRCSEKLTEVCRVEKQVWKTLDELEEDSDELMNQVTLTTKELIDSITKRSLALKATISCHRRGCSAEIYADLGDLQNIRDSLEREMADCSKFVAENHVTEILRQEEVRKSRIETALSKDISGGNRNLNAIKEAVKKFTEANFVGLTAPDLQKLSYLCEYETDSICYSTHFTTRGSLLACTEKGLYECSLVESCKGKLVCAGDIMSVCQMDSKLYYTECIDGSDHAVKCLEWDPTTSKNSSNIPNDLFQFRIPGKQPTFLTVNYKFVIATAENSLMILNRDNSEKPKRETLDYQPMVAVLSGSNELFVTGSNKVRKYCVGKSGYLKLVWTCSNLFGADGIAIMDNGCLMIRSNESNCLYAVSQTGKLLKTVNEKCDRGQPGGIGALDSIIALPYWDRNKFAIFSYK